MNISIDARELCGRRTGAGRYLAGLLSSWAELPEATTHGFRFYAPRPLTPADVRSLGDVRVIDGGGGTLWEQAALPRALRQDRPDVHFAPAYTAPLFTDVPVVITVHDVSFAAHPEWFSVREGLRRRWLTRQAAGRARVVLTDSEFSKQQIVQHLDVPTDRVTRIYPGMGGPISAGVPPSSSRREPLVLFVGSIFNRRHVPELIQAFSRVARRHPDVRLEIVGENRTRPFQDLPGIVDRSQMNGRIAIRSYVDDSTLADLYACARAFVFVSDYEGFGLTPLEALASGVPVIVRDNAISREIYGDAARLVRGDVPEDLEAALEELLFVDQARDALLQRVPRLLDRFTWARAGRETLAAIEAAVV